MSLIAMPLLLILAQPVPAEQEAFPSPAAGEIRVDRGLQVVVFPDRVRLQYDLGLSPSTATAMLKQKSRDLPDTDDRRALMEAFRDWAVPDIRRRCRITADGEPLELRFLDSLIFPKHYVQLTCIFEAPLPATGRTIGLKMVDGSFRGREGNHLIALKTDDGARLQSSTVPLILARVPRQALSSDSAAQREAARRAEAVILRHDQPDETPGETHQDRLAKLPEADEPMDSPTVNRPTVPANTRRTIFWSLIGCCAGILAIILVYWRRIG